MATFGKTDIGSSTIFHGGTGNLKGACRYQLLAPGELTKITAYLRADFNTVNVRAGIYTDVSSYPTVLVAQSTNTLIINTSDAWRDFNFSNIPLAGGEYYWLVFHFNGGTNGIRAKFDTGAKYYYKIDLYSDGLSDPFGAGGLDGGTKEISIYATYTPTQMGVKINEFNRILGSGLT